MFIYIKSYPSDIQLTSPSDKYLVISIPDTGYYIESFMDNIIDETGPIPFPENNEIGLISKDKSIDFLIWNPSETEKVTLSISNPDPTIDISGFSDGDILYPKEHKSGTLTVRKKGPSEIDSTITINDIEVIITGKRVPFLFLRPYQDNYREIYKFYTNIFISENGTESRESLIDIPVRELQYDLNSYSVETLLYLSDFLLSMQAGEVFAPAWLNLCELESSISSGDRTVTQSEIPDLFFNIGDYVVLIDVSNTDDFSNFEIKKIESISGDEITFTEALENSYSTGDLLVPVVLAYIENETNLKINLDSLGNSSLNLKETETDK